jgi:hypothetical protein
MKRLLISAPLDDADQSDPEYPLGPPISIPSDSMQYNNQSADSEDEKG